MKILVYVKPSSKEDRIKYDEKQNILTVWIKENPEKGKANRYLIKLLSQYNIKAQIIKGFKSRKKVLEIECSNADLLAAFR